MDQKSGSMFDFSKFVVFSIFPIFTPKITYEGLVEGFQVRGRRLNSVCYFGEWGGLFRCLINYVVLRKSNVARDPSKGVGGV